MSARLSSRSTFIFVAAAVAVVLAFNSLAPVGASHQDGHLPADKVAVASSNIEFLGEPITEIAEPPAETEEVTIFETRIRSSNPTDLLISLTSECALWTDISTPGDTESAAFAQIRIWIEIDGEPVPVSEASEEDPADDGKVVYCNRTYRRIFTADENDRIDTFFETRSANAFNWIALDIGSGIHDITAKAEISARVEGIGRAQGGIGNRSLIIDPVKLPVGTGLPPQEAIEVEP